MKKSLLFSLFLGISLYSTTSWTAEEPRLHIPVQATDQECTVYISYGHVWRLCQEQNDIYLGINREDENRFSFWQLHTYDNEGMRGTMTSLNSQEAIIAMDGRPAEHTVKQVSIIRRLDQ